MFKVNNENTRMTPSTSRPFSSVSVANFEQVNVSWVKIKLVFSNFENSLVALTEI